MPDELDELKAEHVAKEKEEFYANLEDNIMTLRSDIASQACLLKEMGLAGFQHFLDRVLKLERLQKKWDEWDDE